MKASRIPAAVLAALVAAAAVGAAAEPPVERIEASREGFRPDRLTLRKGEPVRIVLTSADGPHCFAVDAFRVEKRILPSRETTIDLSPEEGGTFPFYCCLEKGAASERERGEIVVTE